LEKMTILWELMVSSTNLPTDEAETEDWRKVGAKAISTNAAAVSLAYDAAMAKLQ